MSYQIKRFHNEMALTWIIVCQMHHIGGSLWLDIQLYITKSTFNTDVLVFSNHDLSQQLYSVVNKCLIWQINTSRILSSFDNHTSSISGSAQSPPYTAVQRPGIYHLQLDKVSSWTMKRFGHTEDRVCTDKVECSGQWIHLITSVDQQHIEAWIKRMVYQPISATR